MDEIKWSKNETISTNLTNIIYNTDSITNGEQEYLQEDLPTNECFNKESRSICLTEHDQFLNENCKISNDSHGKLNIDGLDRQAQIQQIVENTISEESRLRIHQILELVSALTSPEKLLLYLRLPTDTQTISDPLRQPLNPLGSRSEISQTINWIRTHLEEDSQVAMQKQDVYEEYTAYCLENEMKALSTADFGKVMKQVYPKVRPRRLGTRGNSKYCYAGLRKRVKLEAPVLPDLLDFPKSSEYPCSQADLMEAASRLVREWAESLLGVQFPTLDSLACHLLEIGSVDTRSVAALTIINVFGRNSDKALKLKNTSSSPTTGKHRETQLQLQRKLHQREVIREHKRKMQLQSSKCDTNTTPSTKRAKKIKIEETTPNTSPVIDETDLIDSHGSNGEYGGNKNIMTSVTNMINSSSTSSNNANSSPQTITQGNNNITNISGTLRLLPVCDNKEFMSSTSNTTTNTTLQLITLPDFSSFQSNVNNNNNNNNYTQILNDDTTSLSVATTTDNSDNIIHDFSNKKQTESTLLISKQQTTSNKNVNSIKKKIQQETISVKAFANKSISRSNSYEHKPEHIVNNSIENTAQKLTEPPPPPPTVPIQDIQENIKQKPQRLRIPRLPNTKLKPVSNQTTVKYKTTGAIIASSNDIRSHDNIVKQQTVTATAIKYDNNSGSRSISTTQPPPLGYYNQITEKIDNCKTILTKEQIDIKNKLKVIPRERVCSIGNIDKDALDDYLYSGNNSQEPEEEIMQYFQNDSSSVEDFTIENKISDNNNLQLNINNSTPIEEQAEKCDKISQLRLLLEKNLKSTKITETKTEDIITTTTTTTPNVNNYLNNYQTPIIDESSTQKSLILSSLLTSNPSLNTKRRVSFDTYSVPPSPNTRRQHFNFTPISPGPNSPGGKQSKNSSTNASPFVSPRNTPVPIKYTRNRSTNNQQCGATSTTTGGGGSQQQQQQQRCIKKLQIPKDEVKLSIDIGKTSGQFVIPNDNQNIFGRNKNNLPMSAPPSPMLPYRQHKTQNHTNYLQTLLDADVTTSSTYIPNNSSINEYIERKLQVDETFISRKTNLKTQLAKLKIENPIETSSSSQDNSPKNMSKLLVVHSADPLSQEVSQFFPDEQPPIYNNNNNNNVDNIMFRSQSVPLHHHLNKNSTTDNDNSDNTLIYYNQQSTALNNNYNFMAASNVTSTCSSVGQTPVPNEFSDFTGSFGDTTILNNENLDKIFHILQNDQTSQLNFNDLTTDPQTTNELIQQQQFLSTDNGSNNNVIRSQSMDLSSGMMKYVPSRSVPSTPLPYVKDPTNLIGSSDYGSLSKSHPSTPLINETGFNYKHTQIGDYLLNGQPINSNKITNDLTNYLVTVRGTDEIENAFVKTKELSDDTTTYVDDSFTFSDSVLLVDDTNETFNFTRSANVVDDNDLMQLSGGVTTTVVTSNNTATPDTSDNFITSTNNKQHSNFLKTDKIAVIDNNKFVAGTTKLK